jgi:DNA-binding MarR family transcriptional regulator
MKLDKLAQALNNVRDKFKIDSTDLLILNSVIEMNKQGDVLTMQFIKNFDGASEATTHARMKRLVQSGLLSRVGDDENLRIKKLKPTNKTSELVRYLAEI